MTTSKKATSKADKKLKNKSTSKIGKIVAASDLSFSYKNVLNLHEKYIDYLLEKTYFSHDKLKNLGICGEEVESEVREFVQSLIPAGRFKVTHGYIVSVHDHNSEPTVSPQVDLIIVDTSVTHSIFTVGKNSGVEIVPVEAVVGMFEIKRTLNCKSFGEAVEHLKKIIDVTSINKSDKTHYLPGGIPLSDIESHIFSNPLIGVISLDHDKTYFANKTQKFEKVLKKIGDLPMDFIVSLSGMFITPVEKSSGNFLIKNYRSDQDRTEYGYLNQENISRTSIISRFIGYVSAYLSNCTGRKINSRGYFFNKFTWQAIKTDCTKENS